MYFIPLQAPKQGAGAKASGMARSRMSAEANRMGLFYAAPVEVFQFEEEHPSGLKPRFLLSCMRHS